MQGKFHWENLYTAKPGEGKRILLRELHPARNSQKGRRELWCSREESNLHGLPHTVLSRTRLPFRHVSIFQSFPKLGVGECARFQKEMQPSIAGQKEEI